MPYSSIADLPPTFGKLPSDAKRIVLAVLNNLLAAGESEETAIRLAWGAVKKKYTQKEGKWVSLDEDTSAVVEFTHKNIGGMVFPHSAFGYVPDRDRTSTWLFLLWESPEKKITAKQVARALQEFAQKRNDLPPVAVPKVAARIRAAWRRVNPGRPLPGVLAMDETDPQVIDLDGVELFATGTWKGRTFTETDLDDMVSSYQELDHMSRPVILGHDPEQPILAGSGLPAVGWVENLRRVGETLVGDLQGVPSKVATIMRLGGFRKRSSEIYINYTDPISGKTYPYVYKALALLGAAIPEVKSLNDIYALYEEYEVEEGDLEDFELSSGYSEPQLPITSSEEGESGQPESPEYEDDGGVIMSEETRKKLVAILKLSEDASDEEILHEAQQLASRPEHEGDSEPVVETHSEEDVIETFKASEEYQVLVASAAAGQKAHDELQAMKKDDFIGRGLRAGKITPATKTAWVARYEKDSEMAEDFLTEMPSVVQFGEAGAESDPGTDTKVDPNKISAEVKQYQKDNPGVGLEEAYMVVLEKYGEV